MTPLSAVASERGQIYSSSELFIVPTEMAFPTPALASDADGPCPHYPPSHCSTSSDEELDDLHWPTCFRSSVHMNWVIQGITSAKRRRPPLHPDALLIRLLPVFLPPRTDPHHKDFVNLPLGNSACLLPIDRHTQRPVIPTFWVRHVPTGRISPHDPAVPRLIGWLLHWQFENWITNWGYVPDFLYRWEEHKRRLTVFPLISILSDPSAPQQTAYDFAYTDTSPILTILQSFSPCRPYDALDIAPLICFMLGQWCHPSMISPGLYSKVIWQLVLPASLESYQWKFIQQLNEQWRLLHYRSGDDTVFRDFITTLIEYKVHETAPASPEGPSPPALHPSDCQLLPPCHLRVVTFAMDSLESGYCGMVLFLISLLHLHRLVAPVDRLAIAPLSTICWLRHQLGHPWMTSRITSSHNTRSDYIRLSPARHVPRLGGLYTTDCVQSHGSSFATRVRFPLASQIRPVPTPAAPTTEDRVSPQEGARVPALYMPPAVEQSLLEGGVLPAEDEQAPSPTTTSKRDSEDSKTGVPTGTTGEGPALRTRKRIAGLNTSPSTTENSERRRPRSARTAESGVPQERNTQKEDDQGRSIE